MYAIYRCARSHFKIVFVARNVVSATATISMVEVFLSLFALWPVIMPSFGVFLQWIPKVMQSHTWRPFKRPSKELSPYRKHCMGAANIDKMKNENRIKKRWLLSFYECANVWALREIFVTLTRCSSTFIAIKLVCLECVCMCVVFFVGCLLQSVFLRYFFLLISKFCKIIVLESTTLFFWLLLVFFSCCHWWNLLFALNSDDNHWSWITLRRFSLALSCVCCFKCCQIVFMVGCVYWSWMELWLRLRAAEHLFRQWYSTHKMLLN